MRVNDFYRGISEFTPPEVDEAALRYLKFTYVNLWFRRTLLIAELHCLDELEKRGCLNRPRIEGLRDYYHRLWDDVNLTSVEAVREYFLPDAEACAKIHLTAIKNVFKDSPLPSILDFHLGFRYERSTAEKGRKILNFERFVELFHAIHTFYGAVTFNTPHENSSRLELALDVLLAQLIYKMSSHNLTYDNLRSEVERKRAGKNKQQKKVVNVNAALIEDEFCQLVEEKPHDVHLSLNNTAEKIKERLRSEGIKRSLNNIKKYLHPLREEYLKSHPQD